MRAARAAATDAAGAARQRWSFCGRGERAALRVFNHYTQDQSQNDHSSADDRCRSAVSQSGTNSDLEEREDCLSGPRSSFD